MMRSIVVYSSHVLLLVLVLLATTANIAVTAQNGAKESSLHPPLKPPTAAAAALLPKKLPDLPLHLAPAAMGAGGGDSLSNGFYLNSCPNLEAIIHRRVDSWFQKDKTIAASLLRLHFHDCAVRGCDASVLLNQPGSEKSAKASKSLRGFEVIDDIKAEVEKQCPKTVSCADILTAAARDATVKLEGPFWEVPFGRKDGRVSIAREAEMVPMGHENITYLIEFFQARGLNQIDLVVLSGAHTIGRSTCESLQNRLYNFKGTGKADPSIDARYLNFLKRKCRWASEYADLDAMTPAKFDSMYYTNLQEKKGLLSTDQLLYSDPRTAPIVAALATQPQLFYNQFAASMVNLANVQDLEGTHEGEIRANCSFVNSH